MRYGRLAIATVRENSHLHSVGRIAADITCVSSFVLGKITPYERFISSFYRMVKKLPCQMRHGIFSLGHHQQPAGIFVYSVY